LSNNPHTAVAPAPREWTDGTEIEIPIVQVRAGEIVIVRRGE
jgi:cation transport ATPase